MWVAVVLQVWLPVGGLVDVRVALSEAVALGVGLWDTVAVAEDVRLEVRLAEALRLGLTVGLGVWLAVPAAEGACAARAQPHGAVPCQLPAGTCAAGCGPGAFADHTARGPAQALEALAGRGGAALHSIAAPAHCDVFARSAAEVGPANHGDARQGPSPDGRSPLGRHVGGPEGSGRICRRPSLGIMWKIMRHYAMHF